MTAAGNVLDAYTGGTSTMFIVLNMDYCYLSELTPTTVMPLAKTTSQYDEFDIFWDGAIVVNNVYGGSILCNVAA